TPRPPAPLPVQRVAALPVVDSARGSTSLGDSGGFRRCASCESTPRRVACRGQVEVCAAVAGRLRRFTSAHPTPVHAAPRPASHPCTCHPRTPHYRLPARSRCLHL